MTINYDHSANQHSLRGPQAFLPVMFEQIKPSSLIDVGCGVGMWTRAAMDLGIKDVLGVDGVEIPESQLLIPKQCFAVRDFTKDWNFGRSFDLAICFEVGEHLEKPSAPLLVKNLVAHSNTVIFSAACPGQVGQYHINCQWPVFWQNLFNAEGFACDDSLRWKVWNDGRIEKWYRQNAFVATRNPERAGREDRIRPVVHPAYIYGDNYENIQDARFSSMMDIEDGMMTVGWYLSTPLKGLLAKFSNKISKSNRGKK
jgi:SAM-dependent methyltransferase